jgi:anaerobic selenocysteine-containing dehydrogenase
MLTDIEEQQRMERRKLKTGDRVAIVGRRGRIEVKEVVANFGVSVLVENVEYWTASGNAVSEHRTTVLRGLATEEDFDSVEQRIAARRRNNA